MSSVTAGTVVTLTATVVSGSTPVNPGQVRFCDATAKYCEDSALLATTQLTSAGIATYKFRPGISSHSYRAVFVGTNTYVSSKSTAIALNVTGQYPTTTAIGAVGSVGNYALTATVTGASNGSSSPAGQVSFLDTTNANASLGSAALGTSTLAESFTTASVTDNNPDAIAVADFNSDGIADLVTLDAGSLDVLLGNGDGTFAFKSSIPIGTSFSVAVEDFNGDGIPDLAIAFNNAVTVLLGNGDGTFTAKASPAVGNGPGPIAGGDFNGDGIADLAVANTYDNTISVLLGNDDGTFTTKSTASVGDVPIFLVVGDFNADGIEDLAVVTYLSGNLTVLLGAGDGTFATRSSIAVFNLSSAYGNALLAVRDFNGDGIPDLASGYDVFLGRGDGTFAVSPLPSSSYVPNSVAVGDFDGDGISDLAITSSEGGGTLAGGAVTILSGRGDGTFAVRSTPSALTAPGYVVAGDFNGDGLPDLAVIDTADAINFAYTPVVKALLNQLTQSAIASLSNVSVSGALTHQVVASYAGDTNYSSSTSNSVPLLATKMTTALNLTSAENPAQLGIPTILAATLTPYSLGGISTDGEQVAFYNGGTLIGFATLKSGVALLRFGDSQWVGSYTVTATYGGDGNFLSSTGNSVVQSIEYQAATPLTSPPGGTYTTPQTVSITDSTPGVNIYYTMDGTPPNDLVNRLRATDYDQQPGKACGDRRRRRLFPVSRGDCALFLYRSPTRAHACKWNLYHPAVREHH